MNARFVYKLCLLGFMSCVFAACTSGTQHKELYYWGSYEKLLYNMYMEPGKTPPQEQINKLTQDISKANARGRKVAPGIYAHLGMMYAASGDVANAQQAFNTEIDLYPESAVLLDGMMNRAARTLQ